MIRTSTFTGCPPPSARSRRSCRTRSSFACASAAARRSRRGRSSPPSRDLERPIWRAQRARERAALVAEQLALDERRRDRRAVDGDERPRATLRWRGWRAREDLLAGARLAEQQHRRFVAATGSICSSTRRDRGAFGDHVGRARQGVHRLTQISTSSTFSTCSPSRTCFYPRDGCFLPRRRHRLSGQPSADISSTTRTPMQRLPGGRGWVGLTFLW